MFYPCDWSHLTGSRGKLRYPMLTLSYGSCPAKKTVQCNSDSMYLANEVGKRIVVIHSNAWMKPGLNLAIMISSIKIWIEFSSNKTQVMKDFIALLCNMDSSVFVSSLRVIIEWFFRPSEHIWWHPGLSSYPMPTCYGSRSEYSVSSIDSSIWLSHLALSRLLTHMILYHQDLFSSDSSSIWIVWFFQLDSCIPFEQRFSSIWLSRLQSIYNVQT